MNNIWLFKSLLRIGLYPDALGISPRYRKKELIMAVSKLQRKYASDQEILGLLQKVNSLNWEQYKEEILPALDYIFSYIEARYGKHIRDVIIKIGIISIEKVREIVQLKSEELVFFEKREKEDLFKSFLRILLDMIPEATDAKTLIDHVKLLLKAEPCYDYLYFDGECENSLPLRRKAYQLALKVYENLPSEPGYLEILGFSFIELADYEKALKCFYRQAEIGDKTGVLFDNIAWCLMRLGRYEEALEYIEKAIQLIPNEAHVYHDYAAILSGLKKYDEAIKLIKEAESKFGKLPLHLYYLLSSILERKGDIKLAKEHWRKFIELAEGKEGHERALARALKRIRISETTVRKDLESLADKTIENLDKLKKKIDEINIYTLRSSEQIERELLTINNQIKNLESELQTQEITCKKLFEEIFQIVFSFPFTNSKQLREIKKDLESKEKDLESKRVPFPFCVLIVGPVREICDSIVEVDLDKVNLGPFPFYLEEKAKRIFYETFEILERNPLIDSVGIREIKSGLLEDYKKRNVPFSILVIYSIKSLIEQALDVPANIKLLFEKLDFIKLGLVSKEIKKQVKQEINKLEEIREEINHIQTLKHKIEELENEVNKERERKKQGIKQKINRLKEIRRKIKNIENKIEEIKDLFEKRELLEKEKTFWKEIKKLYGFSLCEKELSELLNIIKDINISFTTRDEVATESDLLSTLDVLKKIIPKEENREVYGIYDVEFALAELNEKISIKEKEITSKNKKIKTIKAELTSLEERLIRVEREASKKFKKFSEEINKWQRINKLLEEAFNKTNSVSNFDRVSGLWGIISGRKKRVRLVSEQLDKIFHQINQIEKGFIKEEGLSSKNPDQALSIIKNIILLDLPKKVRTSIEKIENLTQQKNKMNEKYKKQSEEIKKEIEKTKEALNELFRQFEILNEDKRKIEKIKKDYFDFKDKLFTYGCNMVLKCNSNIVCIKAFISNNEKSIAYGTLDRREIFIYNQASGEINTLSAHTKGITSLIGDFNKNILISSGYDGHIILWDIKKKEMIKSVDTKDEILSLALLDSLLFAGGTGKIFIYDFPQLTLKTILEEPEGIIVCMCVDRKNSLLYAGEANLFNPETSSIYVWNLEDITNKNNLLGRLKSFGGWITSLALSPHGKILAAGEGIGDLSSPRPSKIIFWDTETFRIRNILEGHEGWVESLTFLNNGEFLASGDGVGPIDDPKPSNIYIWKAEEEPQLKLKLKAHKGWVRALTFNKELDLLISGGTDGVIIWQVSKLLEKVR